MKATLFITSSCNLRCDYCYVSRQNHFMSEQTVTSAVDFVFRSAQQDDRIDFGFFGGEPLLAWPMAKKAVSLIRDRSQNRSEPVRISMVTNGTLINQEIVDYLMDNLIILQVSCDGAPHVQDRHRRFPDGTGSSKLVEKNLRIALDRLPAVIVNMVYGPDTYADLPESIAYLASLGLKQLILNPDYSADWQGVSEEQLKEAYKMISDLYLSFYQAGDPLFISLIDEKIAVILRGGYGPAERCHMGYGEFAFSSRGYIFPCERLVGNGDMNSHAIGHLDQPENLNRKNCRSGGNICKLPECQFCSVTDFCMNWCGCSNFFASGDYFSPSSFICSSERFAIETASMVLSQMDSVEPMAFINHYAGLPMINSSV